MAFEDNLKGVAAGLVGKSQAFQVTLCTDEMVLDSTQVHHHPISDCTVCFVATSGLFVSIIVQVSSRKFEGGLSF